jgi:quinoprotein dehydrogenase-associated probable ABC transporter substrate-binding protein
MIKTGRADDDARKLPGPLAGRWIDVLRFALVIAVVGGGAAQAQEPPIREALELVDPNTLRVCADPRNLPFSNDAGGGFENKLAELVAGKLGKDVSYTFFPQGMGFVRNTLRANRCDVIMGYPQGDELVQNTNPYYRTSYALVFKPETGLDGVTELSDPRLKEKRIGVVAGTPPATNLARNGLIGKAKGYHLMVDTRHASPVSDMVDDLIAGEIDAALAWGPMAGYYAGQSPTPLEVVLLHKEEGGSRMTYPITMGVRPSDQEWKRTLNRLIAESQDEINAILLDYGVPLLDQRDQPITR